MMISLLIGGTPIINSKKFAVGRVRIQHGSDDTAATTSEPAINVNIGGTSNNIFSSDVAVSTSFTDITSDVSTTHYISATGEVLDIKVAQATGGTPGHDAQNLSVLVIGIPL